MTVDLVLIAIILLFIGLGFKDGFIHTLGRLIGAVAGFVLADTWSSWLSGILAFVMPSGWARVVAFSLVFLLITRLLGFALRLVDKIFKLLTHLPFLKSIDRLLGGILGLGEAIIFMGGVFYLILTFKPVLTLYTLVQGSAVATWINGVFHALLGALLK